MFATPTGSRVPADGESRGDFNNIISEPNSSDCRRCFCCYSRCRNVIIAESVRGNDRTGRSGKSRARAVGEVVGGRSRRIGISTVIERNPADQTDNSGRDSGDGTIYKTSGSVAFAVVSTENVAAADAVFRSVPADSSHFDGCSEEARRGVEERKNKTKHPLTRPPLPTTTGTFDPHAARGRAGGRPTTTTDRRQPSMSRDRRTRRS